MTELPALDAMFLPRVAPARLELAAPSTYPPRILLLYGSLRARSFSRLLVEEAARILQALGCASTVIASGRLMDGFRST